jgi:hypothetical protein
MSELVVGLVDEHVGIVINMHLFRAFAACIHLEFHPYALNDVRMLLGHATFDTTLQYYAYVRPEDHSGPAGVHPRGPPACASTFVASSVAFPEGSLGHGALGQPNR